jgi:hypothetical protein
MPFSSPLPFPFFYLVVAGFALFSLLYLIIASAIIYHLRAYSIPGHIAPHISIFIFTALSVALWLFALFFLFKLP